MLDAGCWMFDAGCSLQKALQKGGKKWVYQGKNLFAGSVLC